MIDQYAISDGLVRTADSLFTAANPDLLVLDSPDLIRRRAAPLGRRAWTAIALLILMVALLATKAPPDRR